MCIQEQELAILEEAMRTLQPFYEATVEMSTEKHTSLSKVIPLVFLLCKFTANDKTPLGKQLNRLLSMRGLKTSGRKHI